MEIKPNKLKPLVVHLLVELFEVFPKALLWPLLVNQVHKSAVFVMLFYVLVVFSCHLKIQLVISVDAHLRAPFQIWILVPEKWHRASKLHVREYILLSTIFCQEYHFSLCSVGGIPIEVTASCDPPFSLPSLISPWNKGHLTRIVDSSMGKVNDNKSRNKSSDPFICLDLDEIINPITIVHVAKSLVLHRTVGRNKGL